MNIEEFRELCLSVRGSSESLPFLGNDVLVFKVMNKMFAYIALEPKDGVYRAHLKCDPERSRELRESYAGVTATHFKTMLWNAVALESDLPNDLIKELVMHSVDEVIKALPKRFQREYWGE